MRLGGIETLLLIDKVRKALKRVKNRVEKKFSQGHPYATLSLSWIKSELGVKRRNGVDFMVEKLKEDYRVGKDGNWLILEEKKETRNTN